MSPRSRRIVPSRLDLATLTCKELAARIGAHLRRFEADPKINRYPPGSVHLRGGKLTPYWSVGAGASGRYVRVTYIRYQGSTPLTKAEAVRYLAALDGGYIGRHQELFRRQAEKEGP